MNRLTKEKRKQVLSLLVEGMSMRAINRVTGVSRNTIASLLIDLAGACIEYQDRTIRNVNARRVQCDEIWSFVGAKQKNVPEDMRGQFGIGDVYTWTCMDSDTKLMIYWQIGPRDEQSADETMHALRNRILEQSVQINTDGLGSYPGAVLRAFGELADHAVIEKSFHSVQTDQRRYSPAEIIRVKKTAISGNPDPKHMTTSHVERQNLTMRMHMRRFTRLTNGFSKSVLHHAAAVAIHFMWYNFAKVHSSLRVTPAMQAGIADHIWELDEIIELLAAAEPKAKSVWSKQRLDAA